MRFDQIQSFDDGGPVSGQDPDYDYASAQAAGVQPDARGHLPDTYKLPNHITFSDESIYHGKNGAEGGQWTPISGSANDPENQRWMFTPGKTNMETHTPEQMQQYFQQYEPKSTLNIPQGFPGYARGGSIQSFDDGGDVDSDEQFSYIPSRQFSDIQPQEEPEQLPSTQFNQIQPQDTQPAQEPEDQPHPGPIGAAVAGAAPAAAPITAAIMAGTRGAAIGAEFGGLPGAIVGGLGAGLVASGAVGAIQDWLRNQYGPSTGPLSKQYEQAAAEQQPLAYNIGRAAPIIAGMGTGIGAVDAAGKPLITPLIRAASGAMFGGVDVLQQGIEKGFGNIDPTEVLVQGAGGAILPKAREWAGGTRPLAATTKAKTGLMPDGDAFEPGEEEAQRAQGQKSAPFNTSNAAGTSSAQPAVPGASTKFDPAATEDPRFGATIRGSGSETDGLKPGTSPGQSDQGIPGASSVAVESLKDVPSDVVAALKPADAGATPPTPPEANPQAPTDIPPAATEPAAVRASDQQPVVKPGLPNQSSERPSDMRWKPGEPLARLGTPPEGTGLEGAEVPPPQTSTAKPGEGTPSGLEGQVPRLQGVIGDAITAAEKRPVVEEDMPSIANAAKDIVGPDGQHTPVYIDRRAVAALTPPEQNLLKVHESVEGQLEKLGMDNEQAHTFATMAERQIAERDGIDWDQYSEKVNKVAPEIENQPVTDDMRARWQQLGLASDPMADIGHHTSKNIQDDLKFDLNSPDLTKFENIKPEPAQSDLEGYKARVADYLRTGKNQPDPAAFGLSRADIVKAGLVAPNKEELAAVSTPEPAGDMPEFLQRGARTPEQEAAWQKANQNSQNFTKLTLEQQRQKIQDARRQLPAEDEGPEGTPHSLGAAAINDAAADMEKATGSKPPPDGAQKAADASTPGRVPFRARRAVENYLNNTWFGKILSPTTMDETGQAAKTDIRGARGAIRRTQDAFDAALGKPMEKMIDALSPDQQREIQIAMQEANPMERLKSLPELEPAIRAMRMTAKKDETFIREHGKLDPDQFQEWYFPQLWKDPKQGSEFYDSWMARQGASGGLKEKQFPDIPAGLAAGMELKYDNPIAAFRERRNGLYQYLMMNNILEHGQDTGIVSPTKRPDDVALSGRGLKGRQMYAPEGYATVFNNAYSPGWRSSPAGKQFMDLAQPTTNWGTGVLLGMSAFHPFTMMNEGFVNQVALAMQQGARDPMLALKTLAASPVGAIRLYRRGLDVAKEWTNEGSMGPELTKIVNNLEDANGRAIGHSDPTYKFLPEGWQNFTKQMKETKDDLQASFADAKTPGETAQAAAMAPLTVGKATLRTIGAIMDTAAKPLFGHVIPMMKNGAFRENMGEWLKHPDNANATIPEQVEAAQKIWDDVENRFGLMTHDNIFWDNKLKEGLQLGLTSYSWQMGAGRNIAGGAAQWALHPSRFSMGSPDYDPRLGSTLALAMTVAAMSSAYQFLKTGEPPKDVNDLLAGRTGGKTVSGQPERAILPGFQKDVYGWIHDPLGEAQNKLGVVPKTALEFVTNKGWTQTSKGPRYGLISNPQDSLPARLGQKAVHAAKNFIPIVGQQLLGNNANPNSNIGLGGRALAIRPAPRYINPGGNVAEDKFIQRDWKITHPDEAKPRVKKTLTPAQ